MSFVSRRPGVFVCCAIKSYNRDVTIRIAALVALSTVVPTPQVRSVPVQQPSAALVRQVVISGRVVDSTTGVGVGPAVVTLSPWFPKGATAELWLLHDGALSDADGRFEIRSDLPARIAVPVSFRVWATYRGTTGEYGASGPELVGRFLQLTPGQRVDDVVVRIGRLGEINGTVLGENGQPMPHLRVSAVNRDEVAAWQDENCVEPRYVTDDRGRYRIDGLAPGSYIVLVPRTTQPCGGHLPPPPPRERDLLDRLGPDPPPDLEGAPRVYASTFSPASLSLDSARPVNVGPGEAVSGIDVHLQALRAFVIAGRIGNACSVGDEADVTLTPSPPPDFLGVSTVVTRSRTGSFRFENVPAGRYTLTIDCDTTSAGISLPIDATRRSVENIVVSRPSPVLPASSSEQVRVSEQATAGTAGVTGIVLDDRGTPVVGCRVTLTADGEVRAFAISRSDGSFDFSGLAAGTYAVSTRKAGHVLAGYRPGERSLPPHWILQEGERLREVLTLSRTATIDGAIRDHAGRGVPSVSVGVTQPWQQGGRETLVPVRTDAQGHYRIANIPPGPYVVVAKPPSGLERQSIRTVENGNTRSLGFANAYFGGRRAGDSAPVELTPGEERGGIDITFDIVELSSIDLSITGASALELGHLSAWINATSPAAEFIEQLGRQPDGRWQIRDLPPGRYSVDVHADAFSHPEHTGMRELVGRADVLVLPGADLPVRIEVSPRIKGTIHLEFAETGQAGRPEDMMFLGILTDASAQSAEQGTRIDFMPWGGSSTSWNVWPGTYRVVPLESADWFMTSVTVDGDEVLGRRFTLDEHSRGDVIVRLAKTVAPAIVGRTTDAAGTRTFDNAVIVFPQDRQSWTADAVRVTAPDAQGRFAISGIPAGAYLVATRPLRARERIDAQMLRLLSATATPVKVTGGLAVHLTLLTANATSPAR